MNRGVQIAIGAGAIIGILFFTRKANAATTSGASGSGVGGFSFGGGSGSSGASAPNVLGMSQESLPASGSTPTSSLLPGLSDVVNAITSTFAPAPAPSYVAPPPPAPAPAPIAAPAPATYTYNTGIREDFDPASGV